MVKILWVEDQAHWISKFKSILEQVYLAISAIKEGANDDAHNPIL
jgi:hypothetical protein